MLTRMLRHVIKTCVMDHSEEQDSMTQAWLRPHFTGMARVSEYGDDHYTEESCRLVAHAHAHSLCTHLFRVLSQLGVYERYVQGEMPSWTGRVKDVLERYVWRNY